MTSDDAAHAGQLTRIDEAECRWLLRRREAGRVAFLDHDEIVVLPVNYLVYDDDIVFRTSEDSQLAAAAAGGPMSFQVDRLERSDGGGWSWSVLVKGSGRAVTGAEELAALRKLPLEPWAPGDRDHWIRLTPTALSGRRIPHDPPVARMG